MRVPQCLHRTGGKDPISGRGSTVVLPPLPTRRDRTDSADVEPDRRLTIEATVNL